MADETNEKVNAATKRLWARILEGAREVAILTFVFGGIIPEHIENIHRLTMIVGSALLYAYAVMQERKES